MDRRLLIRSALATAPLAGLALGAAAQPEAAQPHPYVGMWVTRDGHIRHELLPNGRYDEARGRRRSAYQGRYVVTGDHIDYWDDTGFTADGEFRDGVLYHAGMVLYRER
ncbi:hypothetical protein M2165_000548 [Variovorax sp. TBS-050B]|uniref:Atu4866 domain-containing protein n=1 Tax=Variovorax sp. TBS-050B TaxID=2940551 RepID=UPI0024770152|nr:Atu4866 domain-containing protein [Variovorax sp. TBS-050B]MDH6590659.1 hypothetical protein [Variovorax sp. TBS-050B]